ncbi:hypothetical protein [Sphingopyxis flava]|nr:hypothetical protein [Sphingopyxis flava]
MDSGARLTFSAGRHGFLAYVWDGCFERDGVRLEKSSVVIVEHGATATLVSKQDGAMLLVFNATDEHAASVRAGGHVHVLPADHVPRAGRMEGQWNVEAALFADSDCDTCELWLHQNDFKDPNFQVALHSHNEDEIIVVTNGEIVLGQRHYGPGTVIFVAKDVLYGFRTGPSGMGFINFRPSKPTYKEAGGMEMMDEQTIYHGWTGRPIYLPENEEVRA